MTISYPISLPWETLGTTSIKISQDRAAAISESPWTFASQIQKHQGQRWLAEISLPTMTREQAEPWMTVFTQLDGIVGTFYLGDPLTTTPRGSWAGTPVVDGAGQTGQVLNIKGLVSGATISPGDKFQIGLRLYKYIGLVDAVADGSGEVSIDIWPRLRTSPSDNETIITTNPEGIFRLSSNNYDLYSSVGMEYFGGMTISAIEAL